MIRSLFACSVAMLITGCMSASFNKAAYDGVKKAAVVQYALNPSAIIGTTQGDGVRQNAVDANAPLVAEKLKGLGFEIIPLSEVAAQPGYASLGEPSKTGWYMPAGGHLFNPPQARQAIITPAEATALSQALGVDAVIVVTENWALMQRAMGFKGKLASGLWVTMYDKAGVEVFKEFASTEADASFPLAGGVVSGSGNQVVTSATESVSRSLDTIAKHINAKK